jgi:hypothetical protein
VTKDQTVFSKYELPSAASMAIMIWQQFGNKKSVSQNNLCN